MEWNRVLSMHSPWFMSPRIKDLEQTPHVIFRGRALSWFLLRTWFGIKGSFCRECDQSQAELRLRCMSSRLMHCRLLPTYVHCFSHVLIKCVICNKDDGIESNPPRPDYKAHSHIVVTFFCCKVRRVKQSTAHHAGLHWNSVITANQALIYAKRSMDNLGSWTIRVQ